MPISARARRFSLLRFLFAAFALFAVSSALAAAPARTIVFFGDSLTAGYGLDDPATQGYPALVQKKIEAAGLAYRVVNAGLSGETSAGGLRRIDWVLRQNIDVFVLALGANDGLRGVDPAATRDNLEKVLARVRAKYPDAKLVVAGVKMPPAMGGDFTRAFDGMFAPLAEKSGATLIPYLLDGVGGDPRLNQPDRIHPTAAGQEILAANVWAVLRKVL